MRFGWRFWNWLASLGFLVVVGGVLWVHHGLRAAALLVAVWLMCMPFLWFAESLAQWIGIPPLPGGVGSRPITGESPPLLVLGFAWFILLTTTALLVFQ